MLKSSYVAIVVYIAHFSFSEILSNDFFLMLSNLLQIFFFQYVFTIYNLSNSALGGKKKQSAQIIVQISQVTLYGMVSI